MADERVHRVTMPKWGLSMATGKIIEWLVAEGDAIGEGDDLAEIDTDKIAGTLEADTAGVVRRIVAAGGDSAPVGCTLAVVAPAEVPDEAVEAVAAQAREQLARGVAAEAGDAPVVDTVEVGGRPLAYARSGDGDDVVVLVHGYGGDKNSWLFVQQPLAAGRTVYALDLPGHGDSAKDVGDGALAVLAEAVSGFLDVVGVERAHLVGHSLGGAVVTAVAAAAPGRVRSLTLVAPAGFGPRIDAGYLRGFAAAGSRRELKPHLVKLFADPRQVNRQLVDDLLRYKRLDGVDAALHTLLGTLLDGDGLDVTGELAAAGVRTVAVWGRADRVIPPANAEALLGRAEVRLLDDAGHMAHMEAPAAVVAAVEEAMRDA